MKHISELTRSVQMPIKADEKYQPYFLPLGYVEGIIAGGGGFLEVARAVVFDQAVGLAKKVVSNYSTYE